MFDISANEFVVLMVFVPILVFCSWRAGFRVGASVMLESLHQDGMLSAQATKEMDAFVGDKEE